MTVANKMSENKGTDLEIHDPFDHLPEARICKRSTADRIVYERHDGNRRQPSVSGIHSTYRQHGYEQGGDKSRLGVWHR